MCQRLSVDCVCNARTATANISDTHRAAERAAPRARGGRQLTMADVSSPVAVAAVPAPASPSAVAAAVNPVQQLAAAAHDPATFAVLLRRLAEPGSVCTEVPEPEMLVGS